MKSMSVLAVAIIMAIGLTGTFLKVNPKSGTMAKASESESHWFNDNPVMHMPVSSYVPATPQEIAAVKAEKRKNRDELERLKKISKPIPVKMVVPLTLRGSGVYRTVEVILDLHGNYKVANFSVTGALSGSPEVKLTLFLSPNSKGENWLPVATSFGSCLVSKPIDKATTAKRAKLKVETGLHPRIYGNGTGIIQVSSISLAGVKE